MLFGHYEVHFWSYEGSENGKLKKDSPKGNYKENCLGWHRMTTFSEKPNAFWPFQVHFSSYEASDNVKLKPLVLKAITKSIALVGTE